MSDDDDNGEGSVPFLVYEAMVERYKRLLVLTIALVHRYGVDNRIVLPRDDTIDKWKLSATADDEQAVLWLEPFQQHKRPQ